MFRWRHKRSPQAPREVLFHIGLNKTGTSSLQNFLELNRDRLAEAGICYPVSGIDPDRGPAHHELCERLLRFEAGDFTEDPYFRKIRTEEGPFPRVVISSELFHLYQSPERLSELFGGSKLSAIIYLRDHLKYCRSWYGQNIQSSLHTYDFATFFHNQNKPFVPIIERWEKAIGKDNVVVRPFIAEQLLNGDIVDDFIHHAELGDIQGLKRNEIRENPSISGNLLFLKRLFNHFAQPEEAAGLERELTRIVREFPQFQKSSYVDERIVNASNHRYAQDRAKLAAEYDIHFMPTEGPLEGLLTPDPSALEEDFFKIVTFAKDEGLRFGDIGDLFNFKNVEKKMMGTHGKLAESLERSSEG